MGKDFIKLITVLLVDDNDLILEGLEIFISSCSNDINIIGKCTSGEEALSFLSQQLVDVILMDISMSGMDGIEATSQINKLFPKIKVLGLTIHSETAFVRRMLEAKATGYMIKSDKAELIVNAIRKTFYGDAYFSEEIVTMMLSEYSRKFSKKVFQEWMEKFTLLDAVDKKVLLLTITNVSREKMATILTLPVKTLKDKQTQLIRSFDLSVAC